MFAPGRRRLLRVGVAVAAIVSAYGAGVLTAAGSAARPAAGRAAGGLDSAASSIEANAEHPVDRARLDAAAVRGMLAALGDRWSSYYSPAQFQRFSAGLDGSHGRSLVMVPATAGGAAPVTVTTAGRGLVLVRVAAFPVGTGRLVSTAVAAAGRRHALGMVLDLRGNPGGLLDEAVAVASAFLDGGPVVAYQRRASPVQVLDARGHGDTTLPLVVLVDGGTASAAEVVAAALQDRHRAVIVGARTFGKGTVQEPIRLSDGSGVELTVGRYLTAGGRSLDGVGLEPDIEVAEGSDPRIAMQRALAVLAGLAPNVGAPGGG